MRMASADTRPRHRAESRIATSQDSAGLNRRDNARCRVLRCSGREERAGWVSARERRQDTGPFTPPRIGGSAYFWLTEYGRPCYIISDDRTDKTERSRAEMERARRASIQPRRETGGPKKVFIFLLVTH